MESFRRDVERSLLIGLQLLDADVAELHIVPMAQPADVTETAANPLMDVKSLAISSFRDLCY